MHSVPINNGGHAIKNFHKLKVQFEKNDSLEEIELKTPFPISGVLRLQSQALRSEKGEAEVSSSTRAACTQDMGLVLLCGLVLLFLCQVCDLL